MENETLDQHKENKESDDNNATLNKLTKEYQLVSSKKGLYINREEILQE